MNANPCCSKLEFLALIIFASFDFLLPRVKLDQLVMLTFWLDMPSWQVTRLQVTSLSVWKSFWQFCDSYLKFCWSFLSRSLEVLVQVFSCEFCELSKSTFFIEHLSGGCFWRFYYIAMEWHNGMEQLDSHIFNIITQLGNNKKQPNDNSIYNCILKTEEWLTTDQLKDRLCDLLKPINSKINCIVEKTHILL